MRDFLAFLFFRCVWWEDLPDRLAAWFTVGVVGYSVFKTLEGSI